MASILTDFGELVLAGDCMTDFLDTILLVAALACDALDRLLLSTESTDELLIDRSRQVSCSVAVVEATEDCNWQNISWFTICQKYLTILLVGNGLVGCYTQICSIIYLTSLLDRCAPKPKMGKYLIQYVIT